jgi:ribonuclease HI
VEKSEVDNILPMVEKRVADGTNNQAKYLAVVEVVMLGLNIGACRIHLEGDSQLVVNCITKGEIKTWYLKKHIR